MPAFINCHSLSDCQMYTFGPWKTSFGRRKWQKKAGKTYLIFYGLIKRKSLLSLTVGKKTTINIEMAATNWRRPRNCTSQDNNIGISVTGFPHFNDTFQIRLMIQ